mmetsp:Transcript_11469/g.13089  ORF Transcript_11469/g.13089 Transcript_11469/m.13089 type:complete len:86 (-) Transcript_11469:517-774(-)
MGSDFTQIQLQLNTKLLEEWLVDMSHKLIPVAKNHLVNVLSLQKRNKDIKVIQKLDTDPTPSPTPFNPTPKQNKDKNNAPTTEET